MRNYVRSLGLTALLAVHLAHCALLGPPSQNCSDPRIEFPDSIWHVYVNLPKIDVRSCKVTKTKKYVSCDASRNLSRPEETTYYDITRGCLDLAREKDTAPNSFSWGYGCVSGYRMEVTEERKVSSTTARTNPDTDQLFLPSGTACRLSSGFCYDPRDRLVGYTWGANPDGALSCSDLVQLEIPKANVVRFALRRQYLIFEGEQGSAFSAEMAKEVELCGGRAWTDERGVVVTNDTSFEAGNARDRRHAGQYFVLRNKQVLYESLVEECRKDGGMFDFYFCSVVSLLVYVGLHFVCSAYNRLTNYRIFRRVKGGACKWMCQSWINKLLVNNSIVAETKLRSDIEMDKLRREGCPSYYECRRPN